ncbi:MAG: hypothetical protein GAK35_02626 [Herbaspirillum frisingense]|uniref:Uncharacterized protein n=1 Tax=Herbaspirillum frisingense TaxID=92645 RepID=A0A7V8FVQ8_9BURK|nr:MAG: hypothetical protein GAK35_02626 [Herbaspirillum frisingense]
MSIDLTKVESCDMIRELNKRDAMPEPDLNDFTNEQLLQALGMDDDDIYDPTNWGRFYELFATGRGDEAVADFKKLVERKTERILP